MFTVHHKSCLLLILVSFSESVYNFTPRSTWLRFFLDFSILPGIFHKLLLSFNKLNLSMTTIWLYYNIIIKLIGFQDKQMNVCNDPVSLTVFSVKCYSLARKDPTAGLSEQNSAHQEGRSRTFLPCMTVDHRFL